MSESESGGIKGFKVGFGKQGEDANAEAPREVNERGPLRIVVLSELTGRAEYATGPTPHPDPLPIDKASFDRVMEQLAPSIAIEIADPFAASEPLRIDLRWRELKALRPDAIVEQVPVLRALVDAKRIVQGVKERRVSAADARTQLARILPRPSWAEALTSEVVETSAARPQAPAPATPAAAPAAKAASGNPLDDLLSMVDIGTKPAAPSPAPTRAAPEAAEPSPQGAAKYSAIVSAVAKSARGDRSAPPAIVGSAPERVEKAFARILSDILQHPEVRRIERAWRGLKLLVDNADARAGVELDVIPVETASIEDALRRLADRAGQESSRAPIDLFVVDDEVQATAAARERLERWGQMAESFRAPMIVNGHASMLGADDLPALGKTLRRVAAGDDPGSIAVRGLASREAARWITIALNGVLVRLPYSAQTARVRDLPFAEEPTDRGAHVFAGAAFVIAALCAKSYVKNGWPTAITGPRDGLLGNLPVYEITEAGHTSAIPLETFVTQDAQNEVARAGITMLSCAANHDAAIVGKAPVLYRGPTAGGRADAPATSTLADQLFVGRLANAIEQLAAALPGDADPNAAGEVARLTLAELFENAGPSGPEIAVKVDSARRVLEVTVRPRRFAGVSLEEITLGAALG